MMRAFLFAVAVASASAGDLECAVDGSAAASNAINAGIFAWAATERCGKSGTEVNCAVDILSAIKGAQSMINTILSAVNECGGLDTENPECGLAVSKFTTSVEGFGAAVAATEAKCTGHAPHVGSSRGMKTQLGKCVGGLTGSVAGIFGAADAFKKVDKKGSPGNALHVMDAISHLGSALAGSVGDCSPVAGDKAPAAAGCTSAVLGAFGSLSGIASAATGLAGKCPASPARLYEVTHAAEIADASKRSFLMLAVPIAAAVSLVLGVVGGSRYAKRPQRATLVSQVEM